MRKILYTILCVAGIFSLASAQHSILLDGVDDYMKVSNDASMQPVNAMTIETWIRAESWQSLLFKGTVASNGNNVGGDNGFDLRAGADGKAEFNLSLNGAWATATSPAIMELGTWYHVAGVYDGSTIKLYINGIQRASNAASGTVSPWQKDLYLGENPGWGGRLFNGNIDEVRLWTVARTEQQIRDDINQPLAGNETGLAGYWKMDEGTGTTVADDSPNSNMGTLMNMNPATAWDDNYVCSFTQPDVGPAQLTAPLSGFDLTNNEPVTVVVNNYSLTPATGVQVSYAINGGAPVTENIPATIPSLGNYAYTFTQTADLGAVMAYDFEVVTSLTGDVNPDNNTLLTTIHHFGNNSNFALNFDGVNDFVAIPNHTQLNPANALTLEAWIKADEWKPQTWAGTIIGKDADAADATQTGFVLRAGHDGSLEFVATPGWDNAVTPPLMQVNKWYHVAATFDGASLKVYINGVLQASKAHNDPIVASDVDLYIGECPGFNGRQWNGDIDEVRIWNVARSQQQISENMTQEIQGNEPGLVAYYKLNDGTGSTTAADATGNGHTGTLTNMDPETDWTAGFELVQDDMGVTAIAAPVSGPQWSDGERVRVKIKNFGFNTLSDVPVSYSLNGGDEVTEIVEQSVAPFQSLIYTFHKLEDLSALTSCTVEAHTQLEGDTDPGNDAAQVSIQKSNQVVLFNQQKHNFGADGQLHTQTMFLPAHYACEKILLHINLECPTTGCDPWDQPAFVKIVKEGVEYEIARYITPFGVACGPWTVDVTDFSSVLCGEVQLSSYVQVWGPSGWLVTLTLEYVEGVPEYPYSHIDPLWNTDYWVYGDPGISYDLPEMTLPVDSKTEKAVVRMTNTGHGQGNTDNAAEFAHKTHHLWVGGEQKFTHDLWKYDCEDNPCQPQNGTWVYDRAGWCPGQEVIPAHWDLTPEITGQQEVTLDYVLQEYTNLLNTGYNGGSHTEPYFRMHAYMVSLANEPINDIINAGVADILSPVTGQNLSAAEVVRVTITNYGTQPITQFPVTYYTQFHNPVTEIVTQTVQPGQSVEYTFNQTVDLSAVQIFNFGAMTSLSGDDFLDDDFAKAIVINGNAGVEYMENKNDVRIYPNPSGGLFNIEVKGETNILDIEITDLQGRTVWTVQNRTNMVNYKAVADLRALPHGLYLLKLTSRYGVRLEKIVKR